MPPEFALPEPWSHRCAQAAVAWVHTNPAFDKKTRREAEDAAALAFTELLAVSHLTGAAIVEHRAGARRSVSGMTPLLRPVTSRGVNCTMLAPAETAHAVVRWLRENQIRAE